MSPIPEQPDEPVHAYPPTHLVEMYLPTTGVEHAATTTFRAYEQVWKKKGFLLVEDYQGEPPAQPEPEEDEEET